MDDLELDEQQVVEPVEPAEAARLYPEMAGRDGQFWRARDGRIVFQPADGAVRNEVEVVAKPRKASKPLDPSRLVVARKHDVDLKA